MSLNPGWMPDGDDDRRRKAEIEAMMRSERDRYFRDEAIQREYFDILTRQEAQREASLKPALPPGPFDIALALFMENKRAAESANANPAIHSRPHFASLALPSGVDPPSDDAGDMNDHFSSDAILNRAAKGAGFNEAESNDELPGPQQPYRVAQIDATARSTYPRADANDASWLFDGGEMEARSIFRRDEAIPDKAPDAFPAAGVGKGDRLPVRAPELQQAPLERPDAGVGKGDRLPVFRPELPKPPLVNPGRPGSPGDDAVFVNQNNRIPLDTDGVSRVREMQAQRAESRKLSLTPGLRAILEYAAYKTGLGVHVTAGGQVPKEESEWHKSGHTRGTPDRYGNSPRHDDGHSADMKLYEIREDGKIRYLDSKNPEDQQKMIGFIKQSVLAGATGVGHGYMLDSAAGSKTTLLHIGGGDPAAWSSDKKRTHREWIPPFAWLEEVRAEAQAEHDRILGLPRSVRSPQNVISNANKLRDSHSRYWMGSENAQANNEIEELTSGPAWNGIRKAPVPYVQFPMGGRKPLR